MRFIFASLVLVLASVAFGCSATVNPDPSLLDVDTGTPSDSGAPNDAFAPPGSDGGSPSDGSIPGNDAWIAPVDAWIADDAGPMCTPGLECAGWAATIAMAPREAQGVTPAAAVNNCVIQLHRRDCCGARSALGVNHAARNALCNAEARCDAMYPAPTCTSTTITTDTGESTTNESDVRIRAVDPHPCAGSSAGTCYTCETFVCTTDTCRTAPGINGGCG